jgi:DNA-directed RNA polymerase subunit N (RpoN/RPB10)
MLVPIVCLTCGLSLGDVAFVYNYIRRKRMLARYGAAGGPVAPPHAATDPTLQESVMSDVLEALGVTKCCRTRLVTAMRFEDHY